MSLIILIQKIKHVSNGGFSSEHTTHGPSVFSVYIVLPKAPEILEGQGVGPETDIWAVGVLSFIMWVFTYWFLSISYQISATYTHLNNQL